MITSTTGIDGTKFVMFSLWFSIYRNLISKISGVSDVWCVCVCVQSRSVANLTHFSKICEINEIALFLNQTTKKGALRKSLFFEMCSIENFKKLLMRHNLRPNAQIFEIYLTRLLCSHFWFFSLSSLFFSASSSTTALSVRKHVSMHHNLF